MACAVPLAVYVFSVPKSSVQEACQRQLAGGRFSTSVTRSKNLSGPKYSVGGRLTVISSCFGRKTVLPRKFCEPISHHLNPRSSAHHVVMTGFWVGPDNEDGWGFVQAFLCQT